MVRYTIRAKMGCAVDNLPSPLPQPITAAPEQAPTSQSRTYAAVNPDASDLGTTLSPTPRTIPISFHHQPPHPAFRSGVHPSAPQKNKKTPSQYRQPCLLFHRFKNSPKMHAIHPNSVPPSLRPITILSTPACRQCLPMNEQMLRFFRPRNTPAAKGRKLPNAFHPLPLFLSHRGRGQAQGT